jgi:hypothetical protein
MMNALEKLKKLLFEKGVGWVVVLIFGLAVAMYILSGCAVFDTKAVQAAAVVKLEPEPTASLPEISVADIPEKELVKITNLPNGLNQVTCSKGTVTLGRTGTYVSAQGVKISLTDFATKNGFSHQGYWYRDSQGNLFMYERVEDIK